MPSSAPSSLPSRPELRRSAGASALAAFGAVALRYKVIASHPRKNSYILMSEILTKSKKDGRHAVKSESSF